MSTWLNWQEKVSGKYHLRVVQQGGWGWRRLLNVSALPKGKKKQERNSFHFGMKDFELCIVIK